MALFQYDPAHRSPNTLGGVIWVRGRKPARRRRAQGHVLRRKARRARAAGGHAALRAAEACSALAARVPAGLRQADAYRSAAESALRRQPSKAISRRSTRWWIFGIWSASLRAACPFFDLSDTTGAVTVPLGAGNERFTPLGESAIEHPEPGEVIFVDRAELVSARRWCLAPERAERRTRIHARRSVTVEGTRPRGSDCCRGA